MFAAVTGAAGFGIGFSFAASAQTVRVQKPLTILIGGRGDVGHGDIAYFYTGLSYALAKSSAATPAGGYTEYQIYADYATLLSFGGGGGDGGGRTTGPYDRSAGFGPAVTYHFGPQIAPVHPFVGLGAGYYSEKVYDGSNVSRLGGKIRAGVELKGGFFGEVDYTYIGKAGGATTGRLGARVGLRL